MTEKPPEYDVKLLQEMNEKALQNRFFTPDVVYIDIGLFKDFSIGAICAQHLVINPDEEAFNKAQEHILSVLADYQVRRYDSVEDYFKPIGMSDKEIDEIIARPELHDQIFLLAPNTEFLSLLIRHTYRNQNNSLPANKYTKKKVGTDAYMMEPIGVTYRINTYPLQLSAALLEKIAPSLGEALGVNIKFICKNPEHFDRSDWDTWMKETDCYYLDSLGRFTESDFVREKQGEMNFVGTYVFARKRFQTSVMDVMRGEDFDVQIQRVTAHLGLMCDFEWIQNTDVRLTESMESFIPEEEPAPAEQPSG